VESEIKIIHANVTKVSNNGILTLEFSEELSPIINLTQINIEISKYLHVVYNCKGTTQIVPELLDYWIESLDGRKLILDLTFSLPLFVSSYNGKDTVNIQFTDSSIFKA
jgi:ATP-dependent protease HslVU (ClpYQ) ATPase subunit